VLQAAHAVLRVSGLLDINIRKRVLLPKLYPECNSVTREFSPGRTRAAMIVAETSWISVHTGSCRFQSLHRRQP
jgi:hypothetical protein